MYVCMYNTWYYNFNAYFNKTFSEIFPRGRIVKVAKKGLNQKFKVTKHPEASLEEVTKQESSLSLHNEGHILFEKTKNKSQKFQIGKTRSSNLIFARVSACY